MVRKLIRSGLVLIAVVVLGGVTGCSCHTSTCYDGDCGLVHDNDYWESGVANPQSVLADLIRIFHPVLTPDHKLFYYRKLD